MGKLIAWIFGFIICISVVGFVCNWFADGAKTVQKEFAPSALLKKYEDFKKLSAAIDEKQAGLDVMQADLQDYYDADGKLLDNSRDTRFYVEQKKSEMMGIILMHNRLVADYNTRMKLFNYRFTNVGDLPYTNAEPLPKEHKDYILSLKKQKQ